MNPLSANANITALIMSYSDNRTIQLLMEGGAAYSTRTLESPLFWHSRVETLLGKRVSTSADVDWKEVYYILERELKKSVPSIYNEEDNTLASKILADTYLRSEADYKIGRQIIELASNGKVNILKFVLSDARFNEALDISWVDVFDSATYNGQLEVVELLLSDPRTQPSTNLLDAVVGTNSTVPAQNYAEIVRLLLQDLRVDPTIDNSVVLREYIFEGPRDDPEIVRALLKDGRADPMANNGEPVKRAALNGRVQVLAVLLSDSRVDPTIVNNGQLLVTSVREGQLAVVRLLLRDGRIDPNRDDGAALITAIQDKETEIALTLLEDRRMDLSSDDNWALTEAIKHDNEEVIDKLLTRSDVLDNLSEEDLQLAEQVGNPDVVATIRDALDR